MKVKIKKLTASAIVPEYKNPGDAGFDLHADLQNTPIFLTQGEKSLIPTGLAFEIPVGYEMQVRPRSGLAAKEGVTVLNAPGTIDAGYHGEVCAILINLGKYPVKIEDGMRVAQGVICPVIKADFKVVDELGSTERGIGGFGSTGV